MPRLNNTPGSSAYSSLLIHIFLNVDNPARILPPIQVEYFRSGGAEIRIFVSRKASFFTSCSSRSPNPVTSEGQEEAREEGRGDGPLTRVPPPLRTTFPNKLFRRSISARLIESTTT